MDFLDSTVKYTDWSGKFAVVGKGKSDVDAPPPWEPPVYEPPNPATPPKMGDASEKWFATTTVYNGSAIYWSGDYFSGYDPTFNKITTLPIAGYDRFAVLRNGSAIFIMTRTVAVYQCLNPKSPIPVWTAIATIGDALGSGTINKIYDIKASGLTLIISARSTSNHNYVGVYSGGAIAWHQALDDQSNPDCIQITTGCYTRCNGYGPQERYMNVYPIGSGAAIGPEYAQGHWADYPIWRNEISGNIRGVIATHPPKLHNMTTGTNFALPDTFGACTISGALRGPQVYMFDSHDGGLWLSDDGNSYTKIAAWQGLGWIEDTTLAGGGSLDVTLNYVTQSNVPMRLYNRDGSVLREMTGNFWSLTNGNQTIVGEGLVY